MTSVSTVSLPDQQNKAASKRLVGIDILRTLAIMAVVFIHGSHAIPFTLTAFDQRINVQHSQDLFRFCVPVFIFLWAYFQEISFIKKGITNTFKKFYKLLIPFVFWSLVYFLLLADSEKLSITKTIVRYWTGYGWAGQYYFIILFQLLLLYSVIAYIARKLLSIVPLDGIFVASVLFYAGLTYSGLLQIKPFNLISNRLFIYWVPYVFIAIGYAQGKKIKVSPSLLLAFLSLALILIEANFTHKPTDPYLRPSTFICSIFLSIAFVNPKTDYSFIPKGIVNICHIVAQNTLAIFCLNPLLIITMGKLYNRYFSPASFPASSILIPIISVMLVCTIAIIFSKFFQKIRLGFLLTN